MKYPWYLTEEDVKLLEFEVISQALRNYLTRKLVKWAEESDDDYTILFRKNRLINRSHIISGREIYVLEADDMGEYWPQEMGWHDGEFLLIFRQLSTIEFAEFICELLECEYLEVDEMNALLEKDGLSFRFVESGSNVFSIEVSPIEDMEEAEADIGEHPNIRVLIHRMNSALQKTDYAGVIQASASIFETLAKDIVGISSVQNQTLKSFFARYRKDSSLPEEVLDYILETYESRNVTPLAGHGSTEIPSTTQEQAVVLAEMTRAFVRCEYKMRNYALGAKQ